MLTLLLVDLYDSVLLRESWSRLAFRAWRRYGSCRNSPALLEEPRDTGFGEGFGAVLGPQLAINVAGMGFDGADGDEEVACDLTVGPARSEEHQDFKLPFAQWFVER